MGILALNRSFLVSSKSLDFSIFFLFLADFFKRLRRHAGKHADAKWGLNTLGGPTLDE